MAVMPLAPSTSEHTYTQELIDTLCDNQWVVTELNCGYARLTHPTRDRALEVQIDAGNFNRLTPFIAGRQVSYRRALDFIRSEH